MKLSIITINYNNLDGLKRTYNCVVTQSFTDYEWIVIDGGSTDGSREFIEAHQDSFSHWVSEPDRGVYHAMNKGILQAHGEYLSFMNSGDYYADSETLAEVFKNCNYADILFGYVIGEQTKDIYFPEVMTNNIHWSKIINSTIPHQGSFIRRSLFEDIGLYDESYKISADRKFFSSALINYSASYEFIPKPIAIFNQHGISASNDIEEEISRQRKVILPNFINELDVYSIQWVDLLRTSKFAYFIFRIAVFIARQKQKFRIKRTTRQLLESAGNLKE